MRLMAGDIGRPPLAAPLALFRPACSASRRSSASRSAASCRTIRQLPNNATVQHFIHLRLTDYLGEYNRQLRKIADWEASRRRRDRPISLVDFLLDKHEQCR